MADSLSSPPSQDGTEINVSDVEKAERWRLNFTGIRRTERPQRSPHVCFSARGTCRGCGVAKYYQQQGEMLDGFEEMDLVTDTGVFPRMFKEDCDKLARRKATAIRLCNIANNVLFIAKVYVSIKSGSLAIIASTLDFLLNLLSGFILWFTAHKMKSEKPYHYPIGKKRMQPLGIMVFSSVMATLGLASLLESVQQLVSKEHNISLEGGEYIVKVLVIYFGSLTNDIVKAYVEDHIVDVATNAIGLVSVILASKLYWWIDPVGAIVLALYTMRTWANKVLENVNSLVGKSASPDYLQKLTYLCWNHHQAIQHIDTVKAYTFGSHYFVEVDIVLPSDMALKEAHDIGETLQEKLESLPDVDRAYVHLDYEYDHKPEHGKSY